jgi:DNA-binding SARP family transcriptional activator
MQVRVLGPVDAVGAGGRVTEAGPPQQRLLAALAVDAGRPVTVEALIDRVWDQAPAGARRSLHVLITRVRRLLEQVDASDEMPAEVLRRGGGYVLRVDPDRVDVHRWRRLVEQARDRERSEDERVGLLREAVALWRGEPLSGVPGQWAARTRDTWRQQYLDTVVAWAHAELMVGNPSPVVGPLTDLAGEYPLTESVAAALMRALAAAGRPADALERYTSTRQRLLDELGADPGAELQAVHQAVLRGDLERVALPSRPQATPTRPPAQLPAAVSAFTGRHTELVSCA